MTRMRAYCWPIDHNTVAATREWIGWRQQHDNQTAVSIFGASSSIFWR